MCAICGMICERERSGLGPSLDAMRRAGAHRGPDDWGAALFSCGDAPAMEAGFRRGMWADPDTPACAGLGHARLSIIDLSDAGHQPMADAAGRFWITYNGEVYNYVELRRELEAAGVRFATRTDTEVVLQAFLAWGSDCLNRFNGMWSFGIYDARERRLFLARDRFGVKPLYYAAEPGRVLFASELKQLHAARGCDGCVCREVLADFLFWRFETHTDATFVEGIRSLPPGSYAWVGPDDLARGVVTPVAYWRPAEERGLAADEAADRFRELFEDAVRLRLRSDVPVGITLSGGLDSSSVACVASRCRAATEARPLQAFTSVYDDAGYSEEPHARAVASHAGLDHMLIRPDSGQMENDWPAFIRTMEEPFSSLTYYSNWRVYGAIRERGVPVILSGQGGDELLLGYERYRHPLMVEDLRRGRWLRAATAFLLGAVRGNAGIVRQALSMVYFSLPAVRRVRRCRLVRPFVSREFYAFGEGRTDELYRASRPGDRRGLQLSEFFRYQLPHLLRHEDRVSMSHAIETRLPFLDYRLLEFVLGQADDLLVRQGWSKHMLRAAMQGILPESVRLRRDKMGFDTPIRRMLGDCPGLVRGLLDRHESDPHLDTKAIREAYAAGRIDPYFLCSAVTYLSWRESFSIKA